MRQSVERAIGILKCRFRRLRSIHLHNIEAIVKVVHTACILHNVCILNGEELDLAKAKVLSFTRELDMQHSLLSRRFVAELQNGNQVEVSSYRFVSNAATEIGAIRYTVKALNFSGEIQVTPYLDGDVVNEDSNYDEKFWVEVSRAVGGAEGYLTVETLKTKFQLCAGMWFQLLKNGKKVDSNISNRDKEKYVEASQDVGVIEGDEIVAIGRAFPVEDAVGAALVIVVAERFALGVAQIDDGVGGRAQAAGVDFNG